MPSKKSKLTWIIALLVLVILCAVFVAYRVNLNNQEREDSTATLSLKSSEAEVFLDENKNEVDLAQYANQVRVVNSWATWAPDSKNDLPELNSLAAEYKDRGVVFLAINRSEDADYAKGFLKQINFENPDNIKLVYDKKDAFFTKIEGYAMPETIIFDQKGNVALHIRGKIKPDLAKEILDSLLEE